ncbi:hypothetical protein K7X08_027779 [Anisodus acutangulus]|uniref:Uncharacterized protein n=1 Tax=Anisodus acutangulus TaxID=402998 RepID=A0A9Q1LNG0_9SOLA|nr:hypothetical protein K7X08_027779 [Anisodus acutangulus]
MSAPNWAYLVEEDEYITSPPRSKLGPQEPVFVPSCKENPSVAVTVNAINNSKKSLAITTKDMRLLAKSHEQRGLSPTTTCDIDLGDDMFKGDDEDDMLDICFDKMVKNGNLLPSQERSESNKIKKKTHGGNIVGMVR